MKKYIISLGLIFLALPAFAQESEVGDFYSGIMVDETIEKTKETNTAAKAAVDILQNGIKTVDIPQLTAPVIEKKEPEIITKKADIEKLPAPFGVYWGSGYDDVKATGADLMILPQEGDSVEVVASNLPKSLKDFGVKLDFGDNDELWKITAVSEPQEDTPTAFKTLQLYKKYYVLLEKKYGPGKETYVEKDDIEIGEDGFADVLKSEESQLYSSFSNKDISAKLELKITPDNKGYIQLEYVNNKILDAREQQVIDAL